MSHRGTSLHVEPVHLRSEVSLCAVRVFRARIIRRVQQRRRGRGSCRYNWHHLSRANPCVSAFPFGLGSLGKSIDGKNSGIIFGRFLKRNTNHDRAAEKRWRGDARSDYRPSIPVSRMTRVQKRLSRLCGPFHCRTPEQASFSRSAKV